MYLRRRDHMIKFQVNLAHGLTSYQLGKQKIKITAWVINSCGVASMDKYDSIDP